MEEKGDKKVVSDSFLGVGVPWGLGWMENGCWCVVKC